MSRTLKRERERMRDGKGAAQTRARLNFCGFESWNENSETNQKLCIFFCLDKIYLRMNKIQFSSFPFSLSLSLSFKK